VKPVSLGNMGDLAVGQTTVAIGNPFGLEGTLTTGVISALGRSIPAITPFSIPQAIQTDAAINPGNSGGPLLDLRGNVIGVNAQIETNGTSRTNSGVGFAIPVSVVKRVVPVLIEKGEYSWPWLGVQGIDLSPALSEAMDLPEDRGAYIIAVAPGGPAEKSGLRGAQDEVIVEDRQFYVGGDVITSIDGQPVQSFNDLLLYIAFRTEPGQKVVVTIYRDAGFQDLDVQLAPRPEELTSPHQSE
jgi:2-alkenal reductase